MRQNQVEVQATQEHPMHAPRGRLAGLQEERGPLSQLQRELLRRTWRKTIRVQDVSVETGRASHLQAAQKELPHDHDEELDGKRRVPSTSRIEKALRLGGAWKEGETVLTYRTLLFSSIICIICCLQTFRSLIYFVHHLFYLNWLPFLSISSRLFSKQRIGVAGCFNWIDCLRKRLKRQIQPKTKANQAVKNNRPRYPTI